MVETWQSFRSAVPWEIAIQQLNLLGSHDTERILTRVRGSLPLAQLAAGILLTYPGVPCVYYGDEIGQGAAPNATSRDCMPWDTSDWNEQMRSFYRQLIHLRRTSPALIQGGFQLLHVEEDFIAYLRDSEEEQIIVCANRGAASHPAFNLDVAHGAVSNGARFTEMINGETAVVHNGILPLREIPAGILIWRATF